MTFTALIIDDEPDIRELLEITLSRMDIRCNCVGDISSAKAMLKTQQFDLCLTDMKLPDGDGVDLVSYVQEYWPQMPIAVITAHGNMETAIQSLKAGAFDFLSKPVDLALLRSLISSALKLSTAPPQSAIQLIGQSEEIVDLREKITRVARTQAPIYIYGESGTGKELVARMIHEHSSRQDQPFVPINCGAIPTELMESEFFGHKKGSFTGAHVDKSGLFSLAEGGTLFLDEVAELPAHMQVKLLRVLQEKKVRPIGAEQESATNVRIISASHKNLNAQLHQGEFRNDLYFRINVIQLDIPSLRERKEDIALLADYALNKILKSSNLHKKNLSSDAIEILQNYAFPGNVRELENILERAVAFCDGDEIDSAHIETQGFGGAKPDGYTPTLHEHFSADYHLDNYLEDIERQLIMDACGKVKWKKSAAAKLLGISLRSLRYKLKKLDMDKQDGAIE
ncbi:MAG: two-component system response regulator PilR (NtrC family) [Gammaproteobacteria bacterium]|jgi:two-component system response regulator PilR (NtrC family)